VARTAGASAECIIRDVMINWVVIGASDHVFVPYAMQREKTPAPSLGPPF
jgi:hypothetical protein